MKVVTSKSGYAAIRVATQWYQNHLGGAVKVLLITNDKENKRKASEEGICAETGSWIIAFDNWNVCKSVKQRATNVVQLCLWGIPKWTASLNGFILLRI